MMIRATELEVLSLAAGDGVLIDGSAGDARERHVTYASRIRHLHHVCYSPARRNLRTATLSRNLTVYPTRSLHRGTYVYDATRIGSRLCRQERIDLITTQDPFFTGLAGYLLKRRHGVPLLVNLHGDFYGEAGRIGRVKDQLELRLGMWVLRRADHIRVVGSHVRRTLVRLGFESERISVAPIPVGSAIARMSTPAVLASRAKRSRAGPRRILFVGRLVKEKNLLELLQAFALVARQHAAPVELSLVGEGPMRNEIQGKVTELGLTRSVTLRGAFPQSELPDLYRSADVFVLPSTREGFGMVVLEAQLFGVPCVVSSAVPQELVVDGKTGLVAASATAEPLASAILRLLDDRELAESLARRARESAISRYDRSVSFDRIVGIWLATANGRRRMTSSD